MVAIFKIEVIKKLIPDKVNEIEVRVIDGRHFVFDKESLREYGENFNDDLFYIFLENGYLCRRPKWDKDAKPKYFQFFHIFLMDREMFDYRVSNPDCKGPLHVHHITWCKRIKSHPKTFITQYMLTSYMIKNIWLNQNG